MAEEGKGVALAILGVVAIIAVVGLVLLFSGAVGKFVQPSYAKVYPGHVVGGDTGPGFQDAGESAYNAQQRGECLSNEYFSQNPIQSPEFATQCRPGVRVTEVQRHRAFYGEPGKNWQDTTEGWCCLNPNERVPYYE